MGVRRRWVAPLTATSLFLVSAAPLCADNVKLDGGGSLNGSVTTGSKSVSVRTATGGVVIFDRTDVKQITHGRTAPPKTAGGKPELKRRKLTAEEEAWMPKVRTLVSRLYGSERARVQQARESLLNIRDPDALPALSTHLGSSHNEEARHLYVAVLHSIKGPKPVYYLVALSLFDASPAIRSGARKAFRDDQLDSARLLYTAALRSGPPKLARIAAIGLGEIGDPRGDAIPYLINALISYGTVATMTEPAQYGVLYTNTIYATPGLKMNDPSLIYVGQTGGSSTMPVYLGAPNMTNGQAAQAMSGVRNLGQPAAGPPASSSAANFSHVNINAKGSTTQMGGSGTYLVTPAVADMYEQPIVAQVAPAHEKKIRGKVDHPEVLDALLKITDQKYPGYGYNQDRWRNWWTNEKANRDLQKPAAPDRVISQGAAAH
jgi:hypothetical protein